MRATLAGLIIGTALLVGCDDKSDKNTNGQDGGSRMSDPASNKTAKPATTSPDSQTGSSSGGSAPTGGGGSGAGGNP